MSKYSTAPARLGKRRTIPTSWELFSHAEEPAESAAPIQPLKQAVQLQPSAGDSSSFGQEASDGATVSDDAGGSWPRLRKQRTNDGAMSLFEVTAALGMQPDGSPRASTSTAPSNLEDEPDLSTLDALVAEERDRATDDEEGSASENAVGIEEFASLVFGNMPPAAAVGASAAAPAATRASVPPSGAPSGTPAAVAAASQSGGGGGGGGGVKAAWNSALLRADSGIARAAAEAAANWTPAAATIVPPAAPAGAALAASEPSSTPTLSEGGAELIEDLFSLLQQPEEALPPLGPCDSEGAPLPSWSAPRLAAPAVGSLGTEAGTDLFQPRRNSDCSSGSGPATGGSSLTDEESAVEEELHNLSSPPGSSPSLGPAAAPWAALPSGALPPSAHPLGNPLGHGGGGLPSGLEQLQLLSQARARELSATASASDELALDLARQLEQAVGLPIGEARQLPPGEHTSHTTLTPAFGSSSLAAAAPGNNNLDLRDVTTSVTWANNNLDLGDDEIAAQVDKLAGRGAARPDQTRAEAQAQAAHEAESRLRAQQVLRDALRMRSQFHQEPPPTAAAALHEQQAQAQNAALLQQQAALQMQLEQMQAQWRQQAAQQAAQEQARALVQQQLYEMQQRRRQGGQPAQQAQMARGALPVAFARPAGPPQPQPPRAGVGQSVGQGGLYLHVTPAAAQPHGGAPCGGGAAAEPTPSALSVHGAAPPGPSSPAGASSQPGLPKAPARPRNFAERREWTAVEDQLILDSVEQHGPRWRKISSLVPGRSDDAVRNRWNRLKEVERGLAAGPEAGAPGLNAALQDAPVAPPPDEPAAVDAAASLTVAWATSSAVAFVGGGAPVVAPRKPKAQKEGPERVSWTKQEDETILWLVGKVGHKWNKIAEHLPGRTDHAIRNRFHRLSTLEADRKKKQDDAAAAAAAAAADAAGLQQAEATAGSAPEAAEAEALPAVQP